MDDVQQIIDENNRLKEELRRVYGVERPFICGTAGGIGEDDMPDFVLVAPMYGSDGFALYKKFKPLSAPEY